MKRKTLFISLFLLLILVVIPLFIDFSKYATPYLSDAQKTIGRTIKIGSIKLQILPTPRINIHDVALGNPPNMHKSEMITVKNIEVIFSLIDLLKGKVTIKSIDLNTPEITLEKNKSGHGNWEISLTSPKPSEKEESKPRKNATNIIVAGVFIHHIEAKNATFSYIDHHDGSVKTFSNLKIQCHSEKLTGPYKISILSDTTEKSIEAEILTGSFNPDKTLLNAAITLALQDHRIRAELMGFIDINKKHLSAKLTASSFDFPLVLDFPNQKIDLHKTIGIQGNLSTTPEHLTIADLQVTHPSGQIIGVASYNFSAQLSSLDLQLKHQQSIISLRCTTKDFKEFEYQLSSEHYQDIAKWFTKDLLIEHPINAKGELKIDNVLTFKKTALSLGNAKADANIEFNPETNATKITGQLHQIQLWGKMLNHDLPISGPVAITVKTTPQKNHLGIKTQLSLGSGHIFFEGNLGTGELITKGSIYFQHVPLSDYVINLKSDILVKKSEVDLNIKNIELKSTSGLELFAGGKLLIDLSKDKPNIAGMLTAQPIKLTKHQNESIQFIKALYKPEMETPQFVQIAHTNSRWSTSPINLPLHAFTMNLSVNVPKIVLNDLVFEALQSDISLKEGKLSIPFSAHLYGGKINGSLLTHQSSNEQNISLSAQFDKVNIEKIKTAATHFSQGQASGSIILKTQGNSQYDWIHKLSGTTEFLVKEGVVKGFNLKAVVDLLKKPKKLFDLSTIQNFFSRKETTNFSSASGSFVIKNGIANTKNILIDATDAQLKATGQADLVNWQIQLVGQVLVPSIKNIPPLEFTVKGSLDEPSYNLNLKSLQSLMLSKEANNLISKTIGKSLSSIDQLIPGLAKKPSNPSKEITNENPGKDSLSSPKPEKIVKGLLKNIFR